jgi:hypothetical protein
MHYSDYQHFTLLVCFLLHLQKTTQVRKKNWKFIKTRPTPQCMQKKHLKKTRKGSSTRLRKIIDIKLWKSDFMTFHIEDEFTNIETHIKYLWQDTVRKMYQINRLRRILGQPGRKDLLDHFRETATGIPQPTDLDDDIVEIVSESRHAYALCMEIVPFEPDAHYRNFDKLQKAAPDIIMAKHLAINWAVWHEYKGREDMANEAELVHALMAGNTSLGFLLQCMADFYFRITSIESKPGDFLLLFPQMDGWSTDLAESFKLICATHLAHYFQLADDAGIPDRPDLIFRETYLLRKLKQALLEPDCDTPNSLIISSQLALLSKLIRNPNMIMPDSGLEKFYREQKNRYFEDFYIPTSEGYGYDSAEE